MSTKVQNNWRVERLGPETRTDFFRLHSERNDANWCFCVAWWVETWEGWGERTAQANRELREELCTQGQCDGYLVYEANEPVGWCQVGPRDRLVKLVSQFQLEPDSQTFAISCFMIAPGHRRRGLASHMLAFVLNDLRRLSVVRVEAYPKRGHELESAELWTGPESLFAQAGFELVQDDPLKPVLALLL